MSPYLHFLLVFLLLPFTLPAEVSHITSKEFIEAINDKKSTWTARSNFQKNITDDLLSGIIQTKETFYTDDENGVLNYQTQYFPNISENFDARQEWPECEKIISFIRNQGLCSTSWAAAPASVMSDRICIATEGRLQRHVSTEDIITCCSSCKTFSSGCGDGVHHEVWEFWIEEGIVSGGMYNSKEGCKPDSHSTFVDHQVPTCDKKCSNHKYEFTYQDDLLLGAITYKVPSNQKQIQIEIMNHGPVSAVMNVYEDFFNYAEGVYQHIDGEYKGTHVVKLMGWGVEKEQKYWLATNTWGRYWGKLHGTFKILRGQGHCKIESEVRAGRMSAQLTLREYINYSQSVPSSDIGHGGQSLVTYGPPLCVLFWVMN